MKSAVWGRLGHVLAKLGRFSCQQALLTADPTSFESNLIYPIVKHLQTQANKQAQSGAKGGMFYRQV